MDHSERVRRPSRFGVAIVVLSVLQPLAGFADRNRGQITQTGRLLAYVALAVVVAAMVLVLSVRLARRAHRDRVAAVVAVFFASFFNYSALFDPDPRETSKRVGVLAAWGLLTILLGRVVYGISADPNVRLFAVIFAAMMAGLPSVSYGAHLIQGEDLPPLEEPQAVRVPAARPNVYWIIVDGYGRPDMLEHVVGVDVGPFVDALGDRGFDVSSSSLTSYPRTHLSLASTLEMDYVLEPGHDVSDDYGRFGPVIVGHNRTAARFEALGYQTIFGPAGGVEWATCREDLVDRCLDHHRPSPATGELEQTLLDLTPLGVIPLPIPYADPLTMADGLAAAEVEEPFFAWQHILVPHEPFRFRSDCTARAVPLPRRSVAAEDLFATYGDQIRCLDEMLLEAIDRIVARDPTAVIILQSDHGSDFMFSWQTEVDELSDAALRERYSVLNAIRLPDGCPLDIEGEPLVNTFRIVFACIEGTEPDLLEYRGFVQPLDDVGELEELDPDVVERP